MRTLGILIALLSVVGCTCRQSVSSISPSLGVAPAGVDFGQVKVGDQLSRTLKLSARTQTSVKIASIAVEGPGASSFRLGPTPGEVPSLGEETLRLTFAPTALAGYTATLVISSDDAERPTTRVALVGEGAKPVLEVTPTCEARLGCQGAASATPPAIDFGAEPRQRLMPVPETALPTVVVVNAGPVELLVSRLAVEGPDAPAFTFSGTLGAEGKRLAPGEGFNVPVRFVPTSEAQASYSARLVLEADDVDRPRVEVSLAGTLRPNLAPVVCANLVRVVPPVTGDGPRDYASAAEWDALRMPPPSGYDFRATRDVRPGDLVVVSAHAPGPAASACSFDPEDGRTSLTYAWRLMSGPVGGTAVALAGAATPQVQLRPVVTGEYVLELTVADAQQRATTTTLRFAASVKQDLVAQLQWTGASGVDLDVHLVRPSAAGAGAFSGAFDFFSHGLSGRTSGDLNGYAVTTQRAMPGAGFDFDWGLPGAADDPRLNVDDTGAGELLENVSLNAPENDPACATSSCRYKLLVHAFNDARPLSASSCVVDGGAGCRDGEPCSCGSTARCVSDVAPIADAGLGVGKCIEPPQPVVRLFFRGSASPAAVIPLDTLSPPDRLVIGAPCHLLYVADIEWPARSALGTLPDGGTPPPAVIVKGADPSGRVTAPLVTRFGWRQAGGSLQCSPDVTISGVPWYAEQPR